MKLFVIIPIVLAILIFFALLLLKKKLPSERFKRTLPTIGLFFGAFSIVAIFISYYYSSDKSELYQLAFPAILFIIAIDQIRQNKNQS